MLFLAIRQFRFGRQEVAKTEKAVKDKMHACASLTAFLVFVVRQPRKCKTFR